MDFLNRSLEQRVEAAANLVDHLFRGGTADTRRMPSEVIDEGPQRILHRYDSGPDTPQTGLPVLLLPALAAPATCFDLRRGCSMAEHLVAAGRPTYLVDYGPIGFDDKRLGLEHWIDDVIPNAIRAVSADAGGAPVQLVGYCLGGLMTIGAVAYYPDLPVDAVAMVASPFDVRHMALVAPMRGAAQATGGALGSLAYRVLGGVPAPVVAGAFKATSIQTYLKKPLTLARKRDDRDFLAQVEAVDALMGNMYAYPGRTAGQLYHRMFIANEVAAGQVRREDGSTIDLADVRVPVMNVAGLTDVVVPQPAAHAVGALLPNAPEVRLESAPGGHLGVLTGRAAVDSTWRYVDEFFSAHAA